MENKKDSIDLLVEGKFQSFDFLYIIQDNIKNYLKNNNKDFQSEDFEILKKFVDTIETNSELNYYFLKILKNNKIIYQDNGENWDYNSNLKMLGETLTDKQFELLENSKRENPLKELQEILKAYLFKKNTENDSKLLPFIKKYENLDVRLNFPLITAIERKRIEYYKTLLFEEDLTDCCLNCDYYFENMHKDKDIIDYSLDNIKFCPKTYLLILALKENFLNENFKSLSFFTKNIIKENINNLKHIYYEDKKLFTCNYFEKIEINPEDYILNGLDDDISHNYYFPLQILLLRNESFQRFIKDGEKGFLYKFNLYEDFINYIKDFIKSEFFKQLLNQTEDYKNISILLNNEKYLEEILNETYLRFLPFYGSSNLYGYTNKDMMVSFINSIPQITNNIKIVKERDITNITNICLLFAVAEKFISVLHEFITHLTYSYLNFVTKKKIDSSSKKGSMDEDDGSFFFHKLLRNDTIKFDFLNINQVINLLDGSFKKNNFSEFQNGLKCIFNYDNLINKIDEINKKENGGFLKIFLMKYNIDFTYFKNCKKNNPKICCRGKNRIGISMIRYGCDSYIYGKNK